MFARSIQIKCLVLNTRFRLLERDDKPVETIFSSKGFAYSYIIVLVDNVLEVRSWGTDQISKKVY